jgi:hypothetical protein
VRRVAPLRLEAGPRRAHSCWDRRGGLTCPLPAGRVPVALPYPSHALVALAVAAWSLVSRISR